MFPTWYNLANRYPVRSGRSATTVLCPQLCHGYTTFAISSGSTRKYHISRLHGTSALRLFWPNPYPQLPHWAKILPSRRHPLMAICDGRTPSSKKYIIEGTLQRHSIRNALHHGVPYHRSTWHQIKTWQCLATPFPHDLAVYFSLFSSSITVFVRASMSINCSRKVSVKGLL